MKTLVTGVAGFVGSTLAHRLIRDGHEVIGIDSITDYYDPCLKRRNLADIPSDGFKFVEGDLNAVDLVSLLQDVAVVYHQAGQPGVRKSWGTTFASYTWDNISATQRLLEAVVQSPNVTRVVYASSSSVYGDAEIYPTPETVTPMPRSPYGVTKLAAEHLCGLYAKAFQVPTVSLRYFTVFGPKQRPDMAFTRFCRAALAGEQLVVFGSGEQVRSFTYIDDVVAANLKAAEKDLPPGMVMNIAGGEECSINGVLALIEDLVGTPLDVYHAPWAKGDVQRTGGSTAMAEKLLGWKASTTLRAGLSAQLSWLDSLLRADV